jgi:hypothetical protein
MPIVIYANSFNNCRLDNDPIPGSRCFVWEDNGNTSGPQSAFGWLGLDSWWDVSPTSNCNSFNGQLRGWIQGFPNGDPLGLNYPAPTYSCRGSGNVQSAWSELENRIGEVLFFPINRCFDTVTGSETTGQVDRNGNPVPCLGTPDKYDVIGFVAFRLIDVLRPNQAGGAGGGCTVSRGFPASSGFTLDTMGNPSCFTSAPDAVDGASVSVRRNGGPQSQRGTRGPDVSGSACVASPTQPLNSFDYCYNPTTRAVFWNSAGPAPENQNYDVSFDWSNDGPCGTPPGNNSAHCLVVDYVDQAIGGSAPGQGDPNSNIRAYKLCEPSVPSTCAPITVPVP